MRWLLLKDLQILRRSPLLVALLVLYPAVVAILIGMSFSRGPDRPKVAVVSELDPAEKLTIGNRSVDVLDVQSEVFDRVDAVRVSSREEAIQKVEDGEVLAALVVPEDLVRKLEAGFLADRPQLEIYVNEEDPLKRRLVEDTITSLVADANRRVSREFTKAAVNYLDLILEGGTLRLLGQNFDVLGLQKVERIAREARSELPAGSERRAELNRVIRFTQLAQEGLNLTDDVLAAVGEPITVRKHVPNGQSVPLTTFAAAVAVALSLMFVGVLLAAGSLALERSENTFDRLVRSGSLTRTGLVVEKIALAAMCAFAVTLLMLLGLGLFIPLEWDRIPLWLGGLIVAAAAFGAMGTAIGGLAREVAVASLLAFSLLLPVAFVALVPSGVVSEGIYDLTRFVSALFPFKPTINLMSSVLYDEGGIVEPLLHLIALTAAYGLAGRLALKRFS
jgi:ABC-2 type transport system permease protein